MHTADYFHAGGVHLPYMYFSNMLTYLALTGLCDLDVVLSFFPNIIHLPKNQDEAYVVGD
jgi:hypothetical protein